MKYKYRLCVEYMARYFGCANIVVQMDAIFPIIPIVENLCPESTTIH